MKIICQPQQLNRALQLLKVSPAQPRRIFINAEGDKLQLEALVFKDEARNDDYMLLRYPIPAEVKEPGRVALASDVSETLEIIAAQSDDTLSLYSHEWHNRLDIEGKGKEQWHSLNTRIQHSPTPGLLGEDSEAPWYSFDASHFCQGLKRVLFAALTLPEEQSKRPFIFGVLLHRHEGQDRMVATDGRRLAMSILASLGQPEDKEAMFPRRAIPYQACTKIVDMIESLNATTCRLQFGQKNLHPSFFRLSFECGDFFLRCILPKEDYPDYFKIIPEAIDWSTAIPAPKSSLKVKLNREAALQALELVQAVQPRHYRTEFHVESGKMMLEAVLPEAGRSRVQIPVQYDGPATFNIFNSQYIKEALAQAEEQEITFCFRTLEERLGPNVIELGPDFYYLVMPMK